uniref:histidine protein methyltransferase 1 homolog n=1 Tax=Ciona intestinalis TaxID=7719 RepID=UPI00089DAC6D|nr:histidine protein methyltransferase 1 homolog [Ciona intestinalis]|eukprot:XP_018672502.1 histidine protein methyltransferase 1 homolog [Ciona intestinalis]
MEFKFNFCDSADDGEIKKEENKVNEKEVTIQRYQVFSIGDIQEEWKKSSDIELCCIESLKLNEGEILYMQTYTDAYCDVEGNTETGGNLADKAIPNILDTSDLIPKVYEGGLKLWESCLDLVHFLEKQENKELLQGRVWELT